MARTKTNRVVVPCGVPVLDASPHRNASGGPPPGQGSQSPVSARSGQLHARYAIELPDWLQQCLQHKASVDQSAPWPGNGAVLIASAFDFAWRFHNGQVRVDGDPYILHPVEVAGLLREIGASPSVIAAGLLHDVIEDTDITAAEIETRFGAEVRALVEGVTKLDSIHFTNRTEQQAENLRRMFLAMSSDIRVVLVKLADRLHNMRTISPLAPARQERIAIETLEIYAPLANRLGVGRLKWELEDLAFKVLRPQAFREIQEQVASKRSEREQRLATTVEILRDHLNDAGLRDVDVSGRPKHLYGIWSKMERQKKGFHEIYDVAAVRIITTSLESCYRALAVVHDTFRPIPGRFKDYIGLPKPNGYQSLHTAVLGRHRPIEVQIRTRDMHRVAEFGIAAHWKYKEGGSPASHQTTERFTWLRQLLDWQQETRHEDDSDYLASIKDDLFDEEVFVFTPKGDVIVLRKGSSGVDFAYRIHSEVGNHCQGVRINDRICTLSTTLRNGDIVEVITAKAAHPSLDWLNFVATPTARNRIRQWYKNSHRSENIARGRELLERELGRDGLEAQLRSEAMQKVAQRCNLHSVEDLLASLGFGGTTLHQVTNRLREEIRLAADQSAPAPDDAELAQSIAVSGQRQDTLQSGSPILGVDGLDYRLAGCCAPLPGEAIVGAVALGNHGITIHCQGCGNVSRTPAERRLPVRWNPQRNGQRNRYPVQLRIEVLDRVGVLKDILTRLSDNRINVSDARVRTSVGKPARIDLKVELQHVDQLHQTMDQIRSMADVLNLCRSGSD